MGVLFLLGVLIGGGLLAIIGTKAEVLRPLFGEAVVLDRGRTLAFWPVIEAPAGDPGADTELQLGSAFEVELEGLEVVVDAAGNAALTYTPSSVSSAVVDVLNARSLSGLALVTRPVAAGTLEPPAAARLGLAELADLRLVPFGDAQARAALASELVRTLGRFDQAAPGSPSANKPD